MNLSPDSLSDYSIDLLDDLRTSLAACAPGCTVSVTDRRDDPEQPAAFGVWVTGTVDGAASEDDTDMDLVGAGDTLADALEDALETVDGWA